MVTIRPILVPGDRATSRQAAAVPARRPLPLHSVPLTTSPLPAVPNSERTLSVTQIEAIRLAMKLFVEDDLARGVAASSRIYCDGCQQPRAAAGVIQYDRYVLCNGCATEYEVARARGAVTTPGQYVRDKHFGDGDLHALPDESGTEHASRPRALSILTDSAAAPTA